MFNDPNVNGVLDGGEAPVSGATVFIDRNRNRRPDTGEPSVTTPANGTYQFTGLTPGSYRIVVIPPTGRITTLPIAGLHLVSVSEGQAATGKDFGTIVPPTFPTNRDPVIHDDTPETAPPATGTAGQPWQHEILATDPDGHTLTYSAPVAPEGLVVDEDTGLVAWTPTAEQIGPVDLILLVEDGHGGVDWEHYQIDVAPANNAPVIASNAVTIALEGTAYRYSVRAQDADPGETATLTYELLGTLPAGLSIDDETGVITWANPTGAPTTIELTVVVEDVHGATDEQEYTLSVQVPTGPNEPPKIHSKPRTVVSVNDPYAYQVHATDADGHGLTYRLDPFPAGMQINPNGRLTWTAPPVPGTHNVTVYVGDGRVEVDQPFTITVQTAPAPNDPPRINSSPDLVVRAGKLYDYDVFAEDPDGDPVGFALEQYPAGVSFVGDTGELRWTPSLNQVGTHNFRIVAADFRGLPSEPQIFTVTVTANQPPEIDGNPPTSAVEGTTYSWPIRATDPDGDDLTFRLIDGEQFGIEMDDDGLVHWNVPQGSAGQEFEFEVGISDGLVELRMEVEIQVSGTPTNHAPVILSRAPNRDVAGTPYSYPVVADDPDENDTLRYELRGTGVPSGMSIDPTSGLLTWNPTVAGTYTFWVAAVDRPVGQGGLAGLEQVILVVAPTPRRSSSRRPRRPR